MANAKTTAIKRAKGQFMAGAKKSPSTKGVTGKQAALAAMLMGKKKTVAPKAVAPMDAEDAIDGGADEATEKS